jgi:hypothetical protein
MSRNHTGSALFLKHEDVSGLLDLAQILPAYFNYA